MLTRDALLAFAHFVCIFSLAALLAGELAIFRKTLPADLFGRLRTLDRWYGITAGLVIVTGLCRMFLGPKGAAFYVHNPIFWTKLGLFVVVALLSIAPTVAYLRWGARAGPDGSVAVETRAFERIRGFLWAEVAVFVFIPLCATFMARGL